MEFNIEPLAACGKDLEYMFKAAYDETRPDDAVGLAFNKQARVSLASKGRYIVSVAREDGKAVGYCSFSLLQSWYDGRWYASQDTVYILPEYRKGNTFKNLWTIAEKQCIMLGIKEIQFILPQTIIERLKLWLRLGYKQTAVILTRRV